jgi:tRNA A-37 threonylcarbamoyl transferase component Bud32
MDVPLGVMRPGSSEASYNPTNPGRRAGAPDGSVEIEFPTAVWSADFPQEPQGRPAAMLGDARGGGAGEAHKRKDGLVAPLAEARQELIAARYLVLDRIGQGGMARIFRVRHVELGKDFALKIIHSALSEDAKVKEMFYQEARLASSLDHPNIVLVTDFGVDERLGAFIVMEYLKGETLHSRLRREGKLHQNVACEITLQVAEALQFIHGRDVVHCDIKSENVFLCEPPAEQRRRTIVKLLDFGLSRQKIASGRVSMSEVGGTPAYMAPERINRQSPRPSMDIYSLGILLYEMLTGTLPFNGTVEETLLAQLHQAPEPMSARTGEPPDDRLEALVMRAMAKKPEERQKNMAAVLYELRTVMDMLGIGRRRGRAKAQARGLASERPRDAELLVAECPLPLFMTDLAGNLVLANKAFTAFVNIREDQVAGMPLADTRLGRLCPEVLEDLRSTVAAQTQRQRMLSFPWRSHGQVSMMIWLAPKIVDKQPTGVIGVVHPFGATPTK